MGDCVKYLSEIDIRNKIVLLRCDFNVPVKDGVIIDNSKIIKSLKTINYLLDRDNKVIILSHFGRVKNEEDKENNSLKLVYYELKKYINCAFSTTPDKFDIDTIENNKCILVENTRFTDIPEKRESANDLSLSSYWATFADVFVLDAFGSMHRTHSSTAGITKFVPTYLGFLVEEEITNLNNILNNHEHPFLVIMGGAKADDKIGVIKSLINKCDRLIITGGILNSFLKIKGLNTGVSLTSTKGEVTEDIKYLLANYSDKIACSNVVRVLNNDKVLTKNITDIMDEDNILDNILYLKNLIKSAKLIFLNGTCGMYEDERFSEGTKVLFELLKESEAKVIVGGGDTSSALRMFGYEEAASYISSGGGATLEYISTGTLSVLEYIKENVRN